jgi:hypothetical protein
MCPEDEIWNKQNHQWSALQRYRGGSGTSLLLWHASTLCFPVSGKNAAGLAGMSVARRAVPAEPA